ncbi:MAG: recombination protein O N-terminal domain-containing protein [Candidatus Yonathbacteria bacterium]|nr:recombination protein O N-terminal domain-containing protein [Candidatus Yonathbacteria bacterium]
MAHHIYHTRGIILGNVPTGESNRFYKIFTEELGLVNASAQSVREGNSKLRYALQDFSFVTLDLVRGKEVWRIVGAGEWRAIHVVKGDAVRLRLLARFCALLTRLIQGEGREPELFADFVHATDFLDAEAVPKELVLSFETLVALRVLAHLGYLDGAGYEMFLNGAVWTKELLEKFAEVRAQSLSKINEALRVSHL